jgi:predicted amidohydrolase YtcJ
VRPRAFDDVGQALEEIDELLVVDRNRSLRQRRAGLVLDSHGTVIVPHMPAGRPRSLLFAGGRVRTGAAGAVGDWALVRHGAIAAVGTGDEPAANRRIDLGGATLVPAFCDAHVHLAATGLHLAGMSFRAERSAARIVAALAERAAGGSEVLFGGDFEDPLDEPLDRARLDGAVGDRPALLARADLHSCVVSSALLGELDLGALPGVERDAHGRPTGYLREQAAARAWRWFEAHLPPPQQRSALGRAVEHAYSKGVSSVHEMHVVDWRGWESLALTREVADAVPLEVVVYVATAEVERVAALGLGRIGGDLFLDGSFGSHSAWLSRPYDPPPPSGVPSNGVGYRSDPELLELFTEAQRRGLQVGVHAIGDAAIEQALRTWEAVAERAGTDQVRALGHRIEHFECATDDHMRRAAALGLRASVQPAFDRLWGGRDGMYARRIGARRAAEMNRFGSMLRAGLVIGAGSDSTVTPLDPFLQMASLRAHHRREERLGAEEALAAHTLGAHALAGNESTRGSIEPGKAADFAVLDRDPVAVDPDELLATEVLETWIRGRRVWPGEGSPG